MSGTAMTFLTMILQLGIGIELNLTITTLELHFQDSTTSADFSLDS